MAPLILPAAILAGLGGIVYLATKKKADPNAQPVPGGGPVGEQGSQPTMSPQMKTAFQALLAGSDPDAMDEAATALEPFGFMAEASQLRTQAAALRRARTNGVQDVPRTAPAPSPMASSPQVPAAPAPVVRDFGDVDSPNFLVAPVPASAPAAPAATLPKFARVTTQSPAPSGDLYIRTAPNAAPVDGVGAEKDGIVTVIKQDVLGDGVWSQVVWAGGPRLGPVSGFAKSAFLRPSAVGPQGTAIAGDYRPQVRVAAPSGCRLRKSPSTVADFRAIVGNGEPVTLLKIVEGPKLERGSPGKGGWAHVQYKTLAGWLPLEWLVKS